MFFTLQIDVGRYIGSWNEWKNIVFSLVLDVKSCMFSLFKLVYRVLWYAEQLRIAPGNLHSCFSISPVDSISMKQNQHQYDERLLNRTPDHNGESGSKILGPFFGPTSLNQL